MSRSKKTKKLPKFEPSDSLSRFIPPLFEIGKSGPQTSWDLSRRVSLKSAKKEAPREEEEDDDANMKGVALVH